MDIPLPDDPPLEESSSLLDVPIYDDANRYSPSLPIEDDPLGLTDDPLELSPRALEPDSSGYVSTPTLLGKSVAKKRLLAFCLTKQNSPTIKKFKFGKNPIDEPSNGNAKETDLIAKKKRKKGVLDKARDTISEIEEIKRKENVVRESMQLLYPRWMNREGAGASGTTHLPLPDIEEDDSFKIENLVEKLLAKKAKRERTERVKEAEKRERRERREKEKIIPKSWEEFKKAGFTAYHYRRLKYRREKLSRSRNDADVPESGKKKEKYNLLETPMVLRVPLTVIGLNDEYKEFPSWCVKYTDTKPKISYSVNPKQDRSMMFSRKEMMSSLPDDIAEIVKKFWEMKPVLSVQFRRCGDDDYIGEMFKVLWYTKLATLVVIL